MKSRVPRTVAEILASAVPALADRLVEHRIRRSWAALVGPEIGRRARPRSLVNGCLEVVVDNSPWLHELTLRADELTARLAAQFESVRSLRFTLGALEAEPRAPAGRAAPRAAALSPDDLREIDVAVSAIADPAVAAAARRLLTTARRFPRPEGGER